MSGDPSQKTFGLVVHQIECTAFTIAHAVASMGWRVVVFSAPELNQRPANAVYRDKLLALPGVSVEMGLTPVHLNVLYRGHAVDSGQPRAVLRRPRPMGRRHLPLSAVVAPAHFARTGEGHFLVPQHRRAARQAVRLC